jgi:hypothetical protein
VDRRAFGLTRPSAATATIWLTSIAAAIAWRIVTLLNSGSVVWNSTA